jgi:hypothetical protein
MRASTPDELIVGFPHNILPKVTIKPTIKDIKSMHQYLNTKSMSVYLYKGGGLHGHLGIIMTNAEYLEVANDTFPPPPNPGVMAKIVAGMTASYTTDVGRANVEATRVYCTYHNVDQAFKCLSLIHLRTRFSICFPMKQ